ncbi:hypothetical protein [Rhodococcus sp. NPDC003348]
MKRGQWADDLQVIWNASQDGVIRARTLETLGVPRSTITRRSAASGPWQRILPGVVLLHNGAPTTQQRRLAAQVYGGSECVLSAHTGLDLHGFTGFGSHNDVLLLLPATTHCKDVGYVRVERTWYFPDSVHRGRFRVAPIARCAMDAARRTPNPTACRTLLTTVVQRGDVSVHDLARELEHCANRGSGVPRAVVRELAGDAHSVAEIEAQKLYAGTGLPPMLHNVDVIDGAGEWIARPDSWIDEVALAWEIDSLAHHLSPALHEQTMRRRARMERHGIVVVAHLPRQLRTEPRTVVADLEAAYRRARARPRPDVIAVPAGAMSQRAH